MLEILSSLQSRNADEAAIASGIPGFKLMQTAGQKTADEIRKRFNPCKTLVLCGTGNNGGDGFIIAQELSDSGFDVQLQLACKPEELKGDAALAYKRWNGETSSFSEKPAPGTRLIIDSIFGTGLTSDIGGEILAKLKEAALLDADIVAVDIPSGISADTGEVLGYALKAKLTVTFFRKKIGQLLLPGKQYCGELVLVDIGIEQKHLKDEIKVFENSLELWERFFPRLTLSSHKYSRGHAIIAGGSMSEGGAARLAARAAARAGAGLVTICAPHDALAVYASHLDSIMLEGVKDHNEFKNIIDDKHVTSVLVGPGSGIHEETKQKLLDALALHKSCVIDGDAITVFRENPDELFSKVQSPCVMTPHEGEFKRLFQRTGNKIEDAVNAAKKSGIVIVYKGSDTIIASPDGKVIINENTSPYLATAGSGDVLAGLVLGLMTQGMHAFYAAAAAVWMHSRLGSILGPGLIAEDLTERIPQVLKEII